MHGDFGGLVVADFSDENDVRVVPQDRSQSGGERDADVGVDRDLDDAVDVVFDRIFGRDDLGFDVVEFIQRRVERRRLARSGGAGDQHDAVRAMDGLAEVVQDRRVHPDLVQVELDHGAVQHAHDHRFAEHRGQHADAEVDRAAADVEFDASVLRHATFRDVEVGHDLHTADDGVRQVPGRWNHLVQHAVRTHADLEFVLKRLEVDVRRLVLNRQQHHHVQQLADGMRVHVLVGEVERPLLGIEAHRFGRLLQPGDHVLDTVFLGGVVLDNGRFHGLRGRHSSPDFHPDEVPQVVQRPQILRVRHRHGEDVVFHRNRNDLVHLGHRRGHQVDHLGRNVRLRQIDDRHVPLLGQRFGQLFVGDESQLERDLAEDLSGALFLLFQHVPELILGEISEVDQNHSEFTLSHELPAVE